MQRSRVLRPVSCLSAGRCGKMASLPDELSPAVALSPHAFPFRLPLRARPRRPVMRARGSSQPFPRLEVGPICGEGESDGTT